MGTVWGNERAARAEACGANCGVESRGILGRNDRRLVHLRLPQRRGVAARPREVAPLARRHRVGEVQCRREHLVVGAVRRPRDGVDFGGAEDLLERLGDLRQRRVLDNPEQLLEGARVAGRQLGLDVLEQRARLVDVPALAAHRHDHDRDLLLHRLPQLEEAPRPRQQLARRQEHEDLRLLHAFGEEHAEVGELR